ncbi:hypothetical protein [Teredinibacter waterburyi]|uniref:hypothetical protein n=1 Tax=Teredinibacter waterburyi TaxID=1500538 RepID=UPI00165F47B0|nr:hypothetical protein [Teredinibacter waterburyi]
MTSQYGAKRDSLLIDFKDLKSIVKQHYKERSEAFENALPHLNDSSLCVNPAFVFRLNVPIDFNQVIGTAQKSEFWNIYVFLVDPLPRIPKKNTQTLEWDLVYRIFRKRYSAQPKFKYFF